MTHQELERLLDAHGDRELAPEEAREVDAHLAECTDCARLHRDRVGLRAAIREQIPRLSAPAALRHRVRDAVRQAAYTPARRPAGLPAAARWLALAASLAVVAVGSWRLGRGRAQEDAMTGQVLASHVRSLMPGHLTDVVSSDQHTVKPWFNGKLDFSPPVYDFAGRGYPLLGGRLDYLGGRPVAALAYGRRQHLINVFVWPAAPGLAVGPASTTRQGYHLLHWGGPTYTYFVVSDLGLPELEDFRELLQRGDSAVAPQSP